MSEGIVYADVKFKNQHKTRDYATTSTSNDTTYSEVKIQNAQQKCSTSADDPHSQQQVGSKVAPGGRDPVRVALAALCVLLVVIVIALVVTVILYVNLKKEVQQNTGLQTTYKHVQNVKNQTEKHFTEISKLNDECQSKLSKQQPCPQCPTGNTRSDQCPPCPRGWESYGRKCYYFSSDKLTWDKSRDVCIRMGGHLVIIETKEEQEFLAESVSTKIHGDDKFWIGLTDSKKENTWMWVDNSHLNVNKRFWLDKEPDDWKGENPDGEDCVRMGETTVILNSWVDKSCIVPQKRICETRSN